MFYRKDIQLFDRAIHTFKKIFLYWFNITDIWIYGAWPRPETRFNCTMAVGWRLVKNSGLAIGNTTFSPGVWCTLKRHNWNVFGPWSAIWSHILIRETKIILSTDQIQNCLNGQGQRKYAEIGQGKAQAFSQSKCDRQGPPAAPFHISNPHHTWN